MLSKDEILKADDLPTEVVPVPEWGTGQAVAVRTMPGVDRDRYEVACYESRQVSEKAGNGERETQIRARLAAWTIVEIGRASCRERV